MRIRENRTTQSLFGILALWCVFGLYGPAAAQTPASGQNRPRRTTSPTPTPLAPNVLATPTPAPAIVKPSPTPAGLPSANPLPQATPTPLVPPATVDELRDRIQEILRRPEFVPIQIGLKIKSLDSGRDIFESNGRKLFMPASNMKAYTFATALARMGPEFRFRTSLYANAKPDAAGLLRGDVILYGRGDPSFAASLNEGDYYKVFNDFAAKVAAAGVKRIDGDLIGDESFFTGGPLGFGWEWDDLQTYYGAPVSALTSNDNAVDVYVKPGPGVGAPALLAFGPTLTGLTIRNGVTTGAAGTKRAITVRRLLGSSVLEINGNVPLDDKTVKNGYEDSVSVSDPALVFATLFREALGRQGIAVTGRVRTMDAASRLAAPLDTAKLTELSFWESRPLRQITADALKPSQNLYTELVLRALGQYMQEHPLTPAVAPVVPVPQPNAVPTPPLTSVDLGIAAVQAFLNEAGVPAKTIVMVDGSGLSRHNLITANATVQLYEYMSRHRYALYFFDALPIGGVDGTLKNRFKGTPAEKNVRAKTGTINYVATLSGYVTSAAGERFVFSVLVNNYPSESSVRRQSIDEIVALLAALKARS